MYDQPYHLTHTAAQRLKQGSSHNAMQLRIFLGHRLLKQRLEESMTVLDASLANQQVDANLSPFQR